MARTTTRNADRVAEEQNRRDAKAGILDTLFGEWRTRTEDRGNAAELSFDPRTTVEPVDRLTLGGKQNADIFSTQRWAALRAHQTFAAIRSQPGMFDPLKLDGGAYDRIDLCIVGSSVSGLTFHAMLVWLMREWEKQGGGPDFDTVFIVQFMDSHLRPLQWMSQARDRRIVPRFEYERLLRHDFAADPDGTRVPTPCSNGDAELIDEWNSVDDLIDAAVVRANADALDALDPNRPFLPSCFCWPASGVRDVAAFLLQGYRAITDGRCFPENLDDTKRGQSPTGGPIYCCVNKNEGMKGVREPATHRLEVSHLRSINPADVKTDFVLLARGPGMDITPVPAPGVPAPATGVDMLGNSQDSYWNTPKIELDLKEAHEISVLILGDGDSAAGTVYSTLFVDAQACSYGFLRSLLTSSPEVRRWFAELQRRVGTASGPSATTHWQERLDTDDVLDHLFSFHESFADGSRIGQHGQPVSRLLRNSVNVGLSIYDRGPPLEDGTGVPDLTRIVVSGTEEAKPMMRYSNDALSLTSNRALQKRVFNGAWPENRIVMAMLHQQIELFQHGTGDNSPQILPTFESMDSCTQPDLARPVYRIEVTDIDPLPTGPVTIPMRFKYVFDCRGVQFLTRRGNSRG